MVAEKMSLVTARGLKISSDDSDMMQCVWFDKTRARCESNQRDKAIGVACKHLPWNQYNTSNRSVAQGTGGRGSKNEESASIWAVHGWWSDLFMRTTYVRRPRSPGHTRLCNFCSLLFFYGKSYLLRDEDNYFVVVSIVPFIK